MSTGLRARNLTEKIDAATVASEAPQAPRPRYDHLKRTWHKAQPSLLSSASDFSNYRGLFNLCLILLVLTNFRMAFENFNKYGVRVSPLNWIDVLVSSRGWPALTVFLSLIVYVIIAVVTERAISLGLLSTRMGSAVHWLNVTAELVVSSYLVLVFRPLPATAFPAMFLTSVVWLKLVSYFQTNSWLREAEKTRIASGEERSTDSLHYPDNITFGNIAYYLAAPTLCYEAEYPRTQRIRVRFVIRRALECAFFSLVLLSLAEQYVVPTVLNSMKPIEQLDVFASVQRLLKLAAINILLWLLAFYLLFHSFLNLTSELLRFADRNFYEDWFNATTITEFWRKWNLPVHKFATRHLYLPIVTNGRSRLFAWLAVFLVSAVFHEVLVSVPLGMFRLYSLFAMLAQVPLAIVSERLRGTQYGNILVWLSLVMGQPLALLLYTRDYLTQQ